MDLDMQIAQIEAEHAAKKASVDALAARLGRLTYLRRCQQDLDAAEAAIERGDLDSDQHS